LSQEPLVSVENEEKMTGNDDYVAGSESSTTTNRVGFYSAILTALITLVTFGLAITAIPNSGANCVEGCFAYPYLDTVAQFPKDYLWMPPATVLLLVYVALMASIHSWAAGPKQIFSQIGLSFAIVAAVILASDYFVQFSVIPVSLMNGETEGITLLTQYNPHGLFIVLEDLGYIVMSLSFLFMAPVFTGRTGMEAAVRWVFVAAFILTAVALAAFSAVYGIDRKDRFEVAAISINWLVLIVNGILLSIVFRRQMTHDGHRP
jgi:hypothetical protein